MMMERLTTAGAAQAGPCRASRPGCCVLLAVALTVLLVVVEAVTPHHPLLKTGVWGARHRRAAFTPPTVTSLSPPNRSGAVRAPAVGRVSSSSSSNMPPVVASRAPSSTASRTLHHRQRGAAPFIPGATTSSHPRRRRPSLAHPPPSDQHRNIQIFATAAADQPHPRSASQPAEREWLAGPLHTGSLTVMGDEVAGMEGAAVAEGGVRGRMHHSRPDTFGHSISEDLSHLGSSVHLSLLPDPLPPAAHDPHFFDSQQDYRETDYRAEDYSLAHDYGAGNSSQWPPSRRDMLETNQSYRPGRGGAASQRPLSMQHIVRLLNLTSTDDLLLLLQHRDITFRQLLDFVNHGASEQEVLQLLAQPDPAPPPTSHPQLPLPDPSSNDRHLVQGDSRDLPLPEASPEDADNDRRRAKNRKKGERGRGRKNKQRKNRRKKGKKKQGVASVSDVALGSMATPPLVLSALPPQKAAVTLPPATDRHTSPLPPTTSLPSVPHPQLEASTGLRSSLPASTWDPQGGPSAPLWPTPQASEASILSVTLLEAAVDTPQSRTPALHNPTQHLHPMNPHPVTPSHEEGATDLVQEEYVFPGWGVLVVSGLMWALAAFTLLILVSYVFVKCRKKPAVNNYQVSSQHNKPNNPA